MGDWARFCGRFLMGLLVVAVALVVPYLGLMVVEQVFDIAITGMFKGLFLLATMFFIIVSLDETAR